MRKITDISLIMLFLLVLFIQNNIIKTHFELMQFHLDYEEKLYHAVLDAHAAREKWEESYNITRWEGEIKCYAENYKNNENCISEKDMPVEIQ